MTTVAMPEYRCALPCIAGYAPLYELPIRFRTSPGVEVARSTAGLFGFVLSRSGLHAPAEKASVAAPISSFTRLLNCTRNSPFGAERDGIHCPSPRYFV